MPAQQFRMDEPAPRSLNAEEQREVIAVAARLQAQHEQKQAEELSVEQLEATASEAGIDPAFVRQAIEVVDRQHTREKEAIKKRKALGHVFRFVAVLGTAHLIGAVALFLGAPWLWLTVGLAGFQVLAAIMLMVRLGASGEGYAPGWRVRCPGCGRTKDAGELGIIRIGATKHTKRILANCSQCGGMKMVFLEYVPSGDDASPASGARAPVAKVEVTPPTEI